MYSNGEKNVKNVSFVGKKLLNTVANNHFKIFRLLFFSNIFNQRGP